MQPQDKSSFGMIKNTAQRAETRRRVRIFTSDTLRMVIVGQRLLAPRSADREYASREPQDEAVESPTTDWLSRCPRCLHRFPRKWRLCMRVPPGRGAEVEGRPDWLHQNQPRSRFLNSLKCPTGGPERTSPAPSWSSSRLLAPRSTSSRPAPESATCTFEQKDALPLTARGSVRHKLI